MIIFWPSPSTLRITCSTVLCVADIWAGACFCCLPKCTFISLSVAKKVAKFVNLMPNLLCFFGIYCWKTTLPLYNTITLSIAQCSVRLYSSQNLLFSVSKFFVFSKVCRSLGHHGSEVHHCFQIKESKIVEEAITSHYVWIKWSAVLLLSGPIIFETVRLVMSHLNYMKGDPKITRFFF